MSVCEKRVFLKEKVILIPILESQSFLLQEKWFTGTLFCIGSPEVLSFTEAVRLKTRKIQPCA